MSFNDPDDLKSAFKLLGEQFTDNELQDELDRANRKLDDAVGGQFDEVIRAEVDEQETFNLGFSQVETFDNAQFLYRDTVIDSSEYTGPTDTGGTDGEVTFTTSFAEDEISRGTAVRFRYTPTRFADLELWFAILGLVRRNTLQTRDGQTGISVEEAENQVNTIRNGINAKAGNRLVLDHNPRFRTGNQIK